MSRREAAAKAAAAELAAMDKQLGARKLDAQELQVRGVPPVLAGRQRHCAMDLNAGDPVNQGDLLQWIVKLCPSQRAATGRFQRRRSWQDPSSMSK